MTRHSVWMGGLTMVAVLGMAGSSQAQELKRDSVANGVRIGAGTGAAAGVVLSLATEDICSPADCAYLGGVAGALIGLVVDGSVGSRHPVAPGTLVNDGLGNGALIGALSGAGLALVYAARGCGPERKRSLCTREGTLREMASAAQWMAIVGLLVDAAIPSRAAVPEGAPPPPAQRRLSFTVSVRF